MPESLGLSWTYPSGRHFGLSGVRAGLSGTSNERASESSVTFDVSTMQPAARISICPSRSIPDSGRHQEVLPTRQDTAIAVTAITPDGKAQSHVKIVLKRTDKQQRVQALVTRQPRALATRDAPQCRAQNSAASRTIESTFAPAL